MAMPPLKSTTGQPIKYTVEHYRKDGVSSEAFMDWFTNVVLPKAMPVMKKHNVLKVAVVSSETVILTGEPTNTVVVSTGQITKSAQPSRAWWIRCGLAGR